MTKARVHLPDMNARRIQVHNHLMTEWFGASGLQWALCLFTEAGVLRFLTRPKTGGMSME
ncbi:hypothetical protein [Granulicella sp. L60]|uniref:hypothetical protein n=1 Tax=Granulicella sp. L60 TaxID=1641866 RepID=UPI00131D8A1E|nr:hypothetical protein [Granulicella sp. L60]